MGRERLPELIVISVTTVMIVAALAWTELDPWKRQAVISALSRRTTTRVDPRVENAVRDFMRDVSRWEHAQHARKANP